MNDQEKDQSDTNRQEEQAKTPKEQSETTGTQESTGKKDEFGFSGITAYRVLKKKIAEIIKKGEK